MTKENLQPISELMTSALAPIHTHLNQMDKRLDAIETRLDSMAEDITAIKEDSAVTRTACNTLIKWNEHTSAVVQVPERCLSRKAGIVRCCLKTAPYKARYHVHQTEKQPVEQPALWLPQRNAANA